MNSGLTKDKSIDFEGNDSDAHNESLNENFNEEKAMSSSLTK